MNRSSRAPLAVAVAALATYRLTRLVVEDEIARPAREYVDSHYAHSHPQLAYLVSCPHCVSVYAATLVSGVHMMFPDSRLVAAATEALALSAIAGLLAERGVSQGF